VLQIQFDMSGFRPVSARNENERKSKEWLRIRKEKKKRERNKKEKRISSFSNDETVAGVEFPFRQQPVQNFFFQSSSSAGRHTHKKHI
jgi:hypothetical protein